MNTLTIALSKGRLADQAIELFEEAGFDCTAAKEKSRRLILTDTRQDVLCRLMLIMVRPISA